MVRDLEAEDEPANETDVESFYCFLGGQLKKAFQEEGND